MSLKLIKYIKLLRENALKLERTSINGIEEKRWLFRHGRRIISFLISSALVYLSREGLSELFINSASTILSILVGLFITSLIFSFDKFYKKQNSTDADSTSIVKNTQAYNYFKQFAYITGFNIVISTFVLIILSLNSLFREYLNLNLDIFYWQISPWHTDLVTNFIYTALIVVLRFLMFYWLTRICFNTLFIVSSMVEFMMSKMDDE